jgi:hypothetical protein
MPEDLLGNVFGGAFENPDLALGLLIGGMQRAQDRFTAKLRTVDADGNPFDPDAPQVEQGGKGGDPCPDPK